tara:strand:- start:560 stop:1255 length:696 start_codon:yes stop_codon:yes gene_type:complete
MSKSESPVNDAVRVLQIKALLREIDVIVCMYPYAFAFQQLAKVIGISSQKSRHFFSSRNESLRVLKQAKTPSLILISEQLRDGSGLDLLREIKRMNPCHLCIVVLNQNSLSAQRLARKLHADACINEQSMQENRGALIEALEAVHRGKKYIDSTLPGLNPSLHPAYELPLSERQLEILRLVADGFGNREIAAQLNITTNTVRDHFSEVMKRLEVSNRASAVSTAFRLGLLP